MQVDPGIVLYGVPLLILLGFFLLADPKGILKVFLSVLLFLAPPVVLGLLLGWRYFTAVFFNQIWFFPFLLEIREIIGCCRLRKHGVRTEGTAGRQNRGKPYVIFLLPDGTRISASAATLKDYKGAAEVTVLYDAEHPEHCCIERDSLFSCIFMSCVWLAAGAGILGVTLWIISSSG